MRQSRWWSHHARSPQFDSARGTAVLTQCRCAGLIKTRSDCVRSRIEYVCSPSLVGGDQYACSGAGTISIQSMLYRSFSLSAQAHLRLLSALNNMFNSCRFQLSCRLKWLGRVLCLTCTQQQQHARLDDLEADRAVISKAFKLKQRDP